VRNVLILHREDLRDEWVLNKVEDVYMSQCKIYTSKTLDSADIVIFYCNLTNEYKVLKNRRGPTDNYCGTVATTEDEKMLFKYLMGTV
jgi:hypothetical protein